MKYFIAVLKTEKWRGENDQASRSYFTLFYTDLTIQM